MMPRSFIALWPDAAAGARLHRLALELARADARSRPIRRADLHLTLAFIGELDGDQARLVAAMLAAMAPPQSQWVADRVGSFAGPKVIWAGGAPNQGLEDLATLVRSGLKRLGVPFDARPFQAHVTLVRAAAPPRDVVRAIEPPIRWNIPPPVLARSVALATGGDGARYCPWF